MTQADNLVADDQLNEIISSSEAWTISDEVPESEEGPSGAGPKSTVSSRQVKALFEQILGSSCFSTPLSILAEIA